MSETFGDAPPGRLGRRRRPTARESILDAIRGADQLSRVELAAVTGLTEAAVSMTVRRLLDDGLLIETGRTPTGGKPRTMLRLDPAARLAVGIHLDRDLTTFVLTGQTGGVISRMALPTPASPPAASGGALDESEDETRGTGRDETRDTAQGNTNNTGQGETHYTIQNKINSPAQDETRDTGRGEAHGKSTSQSEARDESRSGREARTEAGEESDGCKAGGTGGGGLLAHLTGGVRTLLSGSGVDRARCLGIGVVWPGPRDDVPHLRDWDASDLGDRLGAETGRPVLVENDATAAAIGEYWVARVGVDRAFAALYMGGGIGAGIVVEGRALRGGRGSAGEFGHMCVRVDGPPCWCGSRGCLEALAGPRTVVGVARADPRVRAEAGLAAEPPRSVAADFAAIARAARAGSPGCLALLEDSARYVAAAAESVVNLLDIDLVVLTGPGFAAASFVYGPAIMRRIHPADSRTWHRSVTVTVSPAAAAASATGAAALILQSDLRRPR